MSITAFKSAFKGGARNSLYRVQIEFPDIVSTEGLHDNFQFYCKGMQIPGVSNGTIEAWFQGRSIKMAGDRQFQPISLNIVNDVDWKVRTAFERWSVLINSMQLNKGATLLADYAATMTVEQLNRDGAVVAKYTFVDAWPQDIASIELGHDQIDQIEEFTVTMEYQWWERVEAGII